MIENECRKEGRNSPTGTMRYIAITTKYIGNEKRKERQGESGK